MTCQNKVKTEKIDINKKESSLFLRIILFLFSLLLLPIMVILGIGLLFDHIVIKNKNSANQVKDWVITVGKKIKTNHDLKKCGEEEDNEIIEAHEWKIQ